MRRLPTVILLAALLVSCRKGGPVAVSGVVRWPAERLLAPDAELLVQIADVSRADAAPRIVAAATLSGLSTTPFSFHVPVDTTTLDRRARYVLLAHVSEGGRPLLVNRRRVELNATSPLAALEVTLEPVPRPIDDDSAPPGLPPRLAARIAHRDRMRSVRGTLGRGAARAEWSAWFERDSLSFIEERVEGDAGARNVVYGYAHGRLTCVRSRGWRRRDAAAPHAPQAVALDWDARGRGRGTRWDAGVPRPAEAGDLAAALARADSLRAEAIRPAR
ncbi:MAG TPA: YbaY family lipoprotein [Candidatus Acidoferrales bacterium]|nr:YbaY family lipoprotein [Candidatus Acidoferrales bacterium]